MSHRDYVKTVVGPNGIIVESYDKNVTTVPITVIWLYFIIAIAKNKQLRTLCDLGIVTSTQPAARLWQQIIYFFYLF